MDYISAIKEEFWNKLCVHNCHQSRWRGGKRKIKRKRNVVMQFICLTSRARVSSSCFSSVFAVHQLVLFLYIHKSLILLSFIPYFCSPFHIYFIIFEIVHNAFFRR